MPSAMGKCHVGIMGTSRARSLGRSALPPFNLGELILDQIRKYTHTAKALGTVGLLNVGSVKDDKVYIIGLIKASHMPFIPRLWRAMFITPRA